MSQREAERSIEIAAPADECFAALTDYESMREWQRAVKRCDVVSRDDQGRGEEVDWEIDAKLRSISYRLGYRYEEPHRVTCRLVHGDMEDLRADYELEARGESTTLVTLSLSVKPGVPMPGALERILEGRLMRGALEDLKKRCERPSVPR